jgi:sugar phosphate isomerase/epimerase
VLEALRENRYDGWLIVEQDILPDAPDAVAEAARDQVANREYLTARGM